MYSENLTEFFGQPVKDFENANSWTGTDQAYRLRQEYDDEVTVFERFAMLLGIPGSSQFTFVIGHVAEKDGFQMGQPGCRRNESFDQQARVRPLPDFPPRPKDETPQLSWIELSDLAPLLNACPGLREFRVRGKPTLSPVRHASLQTLVMESGGIPRRVLKSLFESDQPRQTHS